MPKVGTRPYKRKDGRWCAKYDKGIDGATGKRKYGYIYGSTAAEVKQKLVEIESNLQKGTFIDRSSLTVANWLTSWLEDYKKQSIKPSTYKRYDTMIHNYMIPSLGGIKLQQIKPEHIQKMINSLGEQGLSPRTIQYVHRVLSMALSQAVENEILLKNPAKPTNLPKRRKKEARALTRDEQAAFINALNDDPLEKAIKFVLATGVRVGEMLALTWNDIDFDNGKVKINKNLQRIDGNIIITTPKTEKGKRDIPLLPETAQLLKTQKKHQLEQRLKAGSAWEKGEYVFSTSLGTPLDKSNINRTIHRICKTEGIKPFSVHVLRHTFATRGLEAGIDLKVMQEILGHASLAMTADTYSHVMPDKKKENMEKLKGMFF